MKNDHLGFEILYIYRGIVRKYRRDFVIRLAGEMLVLEVKGQDGEPDQTKPRFLDEWFRPSPTAAASVAVDGTFSKNPPTSRTSWPNSPCPCPADLGSSAHLSRDRPFKPIRTTSRPQPKRYFRPLFDYVDYLYLMSLLSSPLPC